MPWKRWLERLAACWPRPADAPGWIAGWLGDAGERLAARHLRRLGYRILARRYRTPLGEIDLIARDGDCLVFVEVKTRRGTAGGSPAEAVDRSKQQQLTRLASAFLKRHRMLDQRCRFDVVAVVLPGGQVPAVVTHYPNAFEACGPSSMYS